MTDDAIIDRLFVKGDEEWTKYRRNGHLGIVSLRGHEVAALGLYQPHRTIPKIATSAAKILAKCGLRFPGRRMRWRVAHEGVIGKLQEQRGARVVAFLFGNPDQEDRRIIGLSENREVYKMGLHASGAEAIDHEVDVLRKLAGRPHVCPLIDHFQSSLFSVMTLPWLDPISASSESVSELLDSWTLSERRRLSDFPHWGDVRRFCPDLGGEQLVKVAVEHGDLAPWNIRQDKEGKLIAIDWERGDVAGCSGLDLVHCRFQELRHLGKASVKEATLETYQFLRDRRFQLAKWGWPPADLMKCYLATGWLIPNENKSDLIRLVS